MSIILNETEQAKYIIKHGIVGSKPTSTLFILAKYYRQKENLDKEQTFKKLNQFMSKNYNDYNQARWEDIIEEISKKACKYALREIEYVGVTQKELDKISELPNLKYQKIAFSMLCYSKLYNIVSENNNSWINTGIMEIYKTARVTVRHKEDKFLFLNDLWKFGFISFSNKNENLNIRVMFSDNLDEDAVLKIYDFRELGYEYLNYTGEYKFIRCSECGRLIRQNNNKMKYCADCSKKIKNERNKNYYNKNLGK